LRTAPPGDLFHAVRFFNHINSFSEAERKAFPGTRRAVDQYGPAGSVAPAAAAAPAKDDDFDLFEDDEDDAEAQRVKEERLKAYAEKKSKKPAVIAKSSVLLDIKPWDDETDMKALEESVRSINMDGLVWGSSKLVPVAYGVKKLQIQCVIEDDKVSTEALEEQVTAFEDYVQSMDIAAFNKI
jgi:elongation factor 1-beta